MLHDPDRHETLAPIAWDAEQARAAIARFVADAEQRFSPATYWPPHPKDVEPSEDPGPASTTLYFGACGVFWALQYLQAVGAARLHNPPPLDIEGAVRTALDRRTDLMTARKNLDSNDITVHCPIDTQST